MVQTSVRPPGTDDLLSVTATPDRRGRVVVTAVGEVDSYTAPLLDLCLRGHVARPAPRELVVDLAGVTFLGAAGMAVLAGASSRCRQRGVRFTVLSGGRRAVLRPLAVAGLEAVVGLDPVASPAEATRGPRTPARPRTRQRRVAARPRRGVCR